MAINSVYQINNYLLRICEFSQNRYNCLTCVISPYAIDCSYFTENIIQNIKIMMIGRKALRQTGWTKLAVRIYSTQTIEVSVSTTPTSTHIHMRTHCLCATQCNHYTFFKRFPIAGDSAQSRRGMGECKTIR